MLRLLDFYKTGSFKYEVAGIERGMENKVAFSTVILDNLTGRLHKSCVLREGLCVVMAEAIEDDPDLIGLSFYSLERVVWDEVLDCEVLVMPTIGETYRIFNGPDMEETVWSGIKEKINNYSDVIERVYEMTAHIRFRRREKRLAAVKREA